jgi:hypothetical protein
MRIYYGHISSMQHVISSGSIYFQLTRRRRQHPPHHINCINRAIAIALRHSSVPSTGSTPRLLRSSTPIPAYLSIHPAAMPPAPALRAAVPASSRSTSARTGSSLRTFCTPRTMMARAALPLTPSRYVPPVQASPTTTVDPTEPTRVRKPTTPPRL